MPNPFCLAHHRDMGSEFVADSEKLKRWAQEHGFEQTHDVCSHDIDSAAKLIAQRLGKAIHILMLFAQAYLTEGDIDMS